MAGLSKRQRANRRYQYEARNALVKANPVYSPGSNIKGTVHGGIMSLSSGAGVLPLAARYVESRKVCIFRPKWYGKKFKRWGRK